MTNNDEIAMDVSCGISAEEQKEILAQINGIAEKNRRSLSAAADVSDEKGIFKAKKSGSFFPILVNAAALALIIGGGGGAVRFSGQNRRAGSRGDKGVQYRRTGADCGNPRGNIFPPGIQGK
jgi:hypothetical protein